jgi:hypothetical protein
MAMIGNKARVNIIEIRGFADIVKGNTKRFFFRKGDKVFNRFHTKNNVIAD